MPNGSVDSRWRVEPPQNRHTLQAKQGKYSIKQPSAYGKLCMLVVCLPSFILSRSVLAVDSEANFTARRSYS